MQKLFDEMNVKDYSGLEIKLKNDLTTDIDNLDYIEIRDNFIFIFTKNDTYMYNKDEIQSFHFYGKF